MLTGEFSFTPARRVMIPKPGKIEKRPLSVGSPREKIVQKGLQMILETIYEPDFLNCSHGFRPDRSTHSALRILYLKGHHHSWVIQGDISKCFDNIPHDIILRLLSKRVKCDKFLTILRKSLKVGYVDVDSDKIVKNNRGTPQGSVVSPLLANIVLHELDKYLTDTIIPMYTKGIRRRHNPEYLQLMDKSKYLRKKGRVQEAEEARKQAQKMPSKDTKDPEFQRLKYVRYADDFILGFVGPRSEAEEIKQQIGEFLREELKLELSETKTLITHARTKAARFLGYEISVIQKDTQRFITSQGKDRRNINGRIGLSVPKDVIKEKCKDYMRKGKAVHRPELMREDEYTIINTYQLEFRGIANYYQLAYNMHTLDKLRWIMEASLTKTLAHKFRMSVSKVYEKYSAKVEISGKERRVLQVVVPKHDKSKKPLVATWGGIPLSWDIKATVTERPIRVRWNGQTELIRRLKVGYCERCGRMEQLEVHHVRAMKDLHEYPGREKPPWVRRMIALQRKTMVLCTTCHDDIQYGRPLTRPIITLTDIRALQKEALKRY